MPEDSQFADSLADILPKDDKIEYNIINLQTLPKESKSIVFYKKRKGKPLSIRIKHLLIVFENGVPIVGVEIFVYLSFPREIVENRNSDKNNADKKHKFERLIFVSKADTTGLSVYQRDASLNSKNLKVGLIVKSYIEWLSTYPVYEYLAKVKWKNTQTVKNSGDMSQAHPHFSSVIQKNIYILKQKAKGNSQEGSFSKYITKQLNLPDNFADSKDVITKISLFTRAEPQYLFPNSGKNKTKHILNGDRLLKWWCFLINSIVDDKDSKIFNQVDQKMLFIPNSDKSSTSRYFSKLENNKCEWGVGDIFSQPKKDGQNSKSDHKIAIYNIPLLPDDPKGRFLEHLVVENRAKKVSSTQFWVELGVRQEFRLGVVVGVIGIKGITNPASNSSSDSSLKIVNDKLFEKLKDTIIGNDYGNLTESQQCYKQIAEDKEMCKLFVRVNGKQALIPAESAKNLGVKSIANTVNVLNIRTTKSNKKRVALIPTVNSNSIVTHDLNSSMLVRKKPKI
ncbi:unnamed protein product [[Candida] boidinii]|uniref:histone acetyltransferase n=1 Tax=Candida boidinii TaxID=5477 RepID=A0A9W6T2W4_CANBO|nr:unnamed protein product [[Candida] boidinii]GMG02159.1 unnamed protein product [[Candida] boidinii]